MRLSFDNEESFKEVVASLHLNISPSDPNPLQRMSNEDIYFNSNPPSDPNVLRLVGSSSPIVELDR